MAYNKNLSLVQRSAIGWGRSASGLAGQLWACSMCISCSFHSKWQTHRRSEWKPIGPCKAVAQNWHAVTCSHIPLAKASMAKAKVNGIGK